jgi:hypothetical protein
MSYDCMPMEELAGSDWFVWSDHEWYVLAKLPREVEDAGSYSVNFHVIPRHAFSPKSPFWPRNSWLPSLSPQILEPCESASLQERNMISITSAYCLRCLAYESTVLNGPAYSHGLLQQRLDLELGKCEGIYMPHMSSFWILPYTAMSQGASLLSRTDLQAKCISWGTMTLRWDPHRHPSGKPGALG